MDKRQNHGFTLVELLVTLTVLSIVITLSAFGLIAWQEWSTFKKQNEYAQTLFIAAQNQLAEYSANGKLKDLQNDFKTDGAYDSQYILDVTTLVNSEGNQYDLTNVWPESKDKGNETERKKYQGTIIHLQADAGEYSQYSANPENFRKTDKESYWVYEILSSYVYDTTILENAAVVLELTPEEGQMFAVLYSDKNEKLVYKSVGIGADGKYEITDTVPSASVREEEYRNNYMVGYYGVDTLTISTKAKKVSVKNVKLNNEDTLNLSFDLGGNTSLLGQMSYDINVYEKQGDRLLMSFTLNGSPVDGNPGIMNIESARAVSETTNAMTELRPQRVSAKRYIYDDSNLQKVQTLDNMPILCWVDPDGKTVRVILDAVDIQATTWLYKSEINLIKNRTKDVLTVAGGSSTDSKSSFMETMSYFRFGLTTNEIYCSVQAKSGTSSSAESNSNSEYPVFGKKSGTNTTENNKTEKEYTLDNARHLYNVRYVEELNYDQQKMVATTALSYPADITTFRLFASVDWNEFQDKGQVFDTYKTTKNVNESYIIDASEGRHVPFPSIAQIRANDSFIGNNNTISGLMASQKANQLYQIYLNQAGTSSLSMKPTALVLVNYGQLTNLKMDDVRMFGNQIVGGFMAINAGTCDNLEFKNTEGKSVVSGRSNVGGIIGYQLVTSDNMIIENLVNYSKVEGNMAVGGILGMLRNDFGNKALNLSELSGLSDSAIEALKNKTTTAKITVRDCDNYGAIVPVNLKDLKDKQYASDGRNSNDTLRGAAGSDDIDYSDEAKFLGGIVGYCYNKNGENYASNPNALEMMQIVNCNSSPEYFDNPIERISANADSKKQGELRLELKKELQGIYVGGIVGYNYFGNISACNTETRKGHSGFVYGYEYVGGIVGMNIGPTSGVLGGDSNKRGLNQNNVVGYKYVGGITGSNANISANDNYDPELMTSVINLSDDRTLLAKISNWKNEGVVLAIDSYAGGITGYNTGWLYNCSSEIDPGAVNEAFSKIYSGDYVGGIAGYNNGYIGNTVRDEKTGKKNDSRTKEAKKINITCYMTGENYIGGIVGYNDVDAYVEDYAVAGGYVMGGDNSHFVGGYAGFNASINLLVDEENKKGRELYSNPDKVTGSYFVGGNIGGNIVDVSKLGSGQDFNGIPTNPTEATVEVKDNEVYAEFGYFGGVHDAGNGKYYVSYQLYPQNNSKETVSNWRVQLKDIAANISGFNVVPDSNNIYESEYKVITWSPTGWNKDLGSHGGTYCSGKIYSDNKANLEAFIAEYSNRSKRVPIVFYNPPENSPGQYWGIGSDKDKVNVTFYRKAPTSNEFVIRVDNQTGVEMPNMRIDVIAPRTFTGYSTNVGAVTYVNNLFSFSVNSSNHNMIKGVWECILYVDGLPDNEAPLFLAQTPIITCNNVVYSGNPTLNTPGLDPGLDIKDGKQALYAYCQTNNFLGLVRGDAFVGGFIGYNLLVSDPNAKDLPVQVSSELINSFDKIDASMSSESKEKILTAKVNLVDGVTDDKTNSLGFSVKPADKAMIYLTGQDGVATQNKLGSVVGDIYVGGIVGYNDAKTNLTIENVVNNTAVVANTAITNPLEQPGLKDYKSDEFTYSYAGGISGKINDNMTVINCKNSFGATVTTKGSYTGGIAEINSGTIINCTSASIGSSMKDYVGSIAGLNKEGATVSACSVEGKTITGRNVVGGIVAENYGTILSANINDVTINVAGVNVTTENGNIREGISGAIAGKNKGNISISVNAVNLHINSKGDYVGGITGINEGSISTNKITKDAAGNVTNHLVITGTITGNKNVGGVVGCNNGGNDDVITGFRNEAEVVAVNGNAGGIVGRNDIDLYTTSKIEGVIDNCINAGVVQATLSGDAGGITTINAGRVSNCTDYGRVVAPNGKSGGICSENEKEALVINCLVMPETAKGNTSLDFSSKDVVGGIAADNYGTVSSCRVEKLNVYNYTSSGISSIGVVVGVNYDTGVILLPDGDVVKESTARTYTDGSYVGGITGENYGEIKGKDVTITRKHTDVPYGNVALNQTKNVNAIEMTLPTSTVRVDVGFMKGYGSTATLGGVSGLNRGKISSVKVVGNIVGNMGNESSGYGGIVGYNGSGEYSDEIAKQILSDKKYKAVVEYCTFDGLVSAQGSSAKVANLGGITGYNSYDGKVAFCEIGVDDKEDSTNILAGNVLEGKDESSFVYMGGIAGCNRGAILDCDNHKYSTDKVWIDGFCGEIGGIAGRTLKYGYFTGEKDGSALLTSGDKWTIRSRHNSNMDGFGGIAGCVYSGESMYFVRNYAKVESYGASNSMVGGIAGLISHDYNMNMEIVGCINYGDILGKAEGTSSPGSTGTRTGGFVGSFKYMGVKIYDSTNMGTIHCSGEVPAGFIAQAHSLVSNMYFENCYNHGNIWSDGNKPSGGFIGWFVNSNGGYGVFYNCVNTGLVGLKDGNRSGFVGQGTGNEIFDLCRNYNTVPGSYAFSATGNVTAISNSLDAGAGNRSFSTTHFLKGTLSRAYNNYYLQPLDADIMTEASFSVKADSYVYWNEGKYSGKYGAFDNDTLLPSSYISATTESMIETGKLTYTFDVNIAPSSQGMDSFVFYLRSEPYDYVVTFKDDNGNVGYVDTAIALNGGNAAGTKITCTDAKDPEYGKLGIKGSNAELCPQIIKIADAVDGSGNAVSLDKTKIKQIVVTIRKWKSDKVVTGGSGSPKVQGFGWIPVSTMDGNGNYSIISLKSSLYDESDVTFEIASSKCNSANATNQTYSLYGNKEVTKGIVTINDLLYEIDKEAKYSYQIKTNTAAKPWLLDINVDDSNGKLDTFEFSLTGRYADDAHADDTQGKYSYISVLMTDISGNKGRYTYYSTDYTGDYLVTGSGIIDPRLDSVSGSKDIYSFSKSQMGLNADAQIVKIQVEVQPVNANFIYTKGFSWKDSAGNTYAPKMALNSTYETMDSITSLEGTLLKVKNQYWVYPKYSDTEGFTTANNPISDEFYGDNVIDTKGKGYANDYEYSKHVSSGSRVNIYEQVDPKYIQFVYREMGNLSKLGAPTGFKVSKELGMYKLTWNEVTGAAGYEIYYELLDSAKNVQYTSVREKAHIGGKTFVDPEAVNAIIVENNLQDIKKIKFYIVAVSPYHYLHENDMSAAEYTKYDSDAASVETDSVQTLPMPEVHYEQVGLTKTAIIIDNFADFDGYTTVCNVNAYNTKGPSKGYTFSDEDMARGYMIVDSLQMSTKNEDETIKVYSVAKNATQYMNSPYFAKFGGLYPSAQMLKDETMLKSSDYYIKHTFNGLYGDSVDQLKYKLTYDVLKVDNFYSTDLVAFDKTLGIEVAYTYGESHTACRTGAGKATFVATLDGFTKDMLKEDFQIRSYIIGGQNKFNQFGHQVYDDIEINSNEDLKDLVDKLHHDPDTGIRDDGGFKIAEESGGKYTLKPGYIVAHVEANKYDVYYNVGLYLSEVSGVAGKECYQVRRAVYTYVPASGGTPAYYDISGSDKSQTGNKLYFANEPVLEDTYDVNANDSGVEEYTFKWDQKWDISDSSSDADYKNARYTIELFGQTVDGEKVSLETVSNVNENKHTFTADSSWNYSYLILEVTRLGVTNSATNLIEKLPSTAVKDYQVKIPFDQLAAPTVSLTVNDKGEYEKDKLEYFVDWTGLSSQSQITECNGYLITVEAEETDGIATPTDTHYYYALNSALGSAGKNTVTKDTAGIPPTLKNMLSGPMASNVISASDYKELDASRMEYRATIDLSDFKDDEKIKISVKALVAGDDASYVYRDGLDGVISEMIIPIRLEKPLESGMSAYLSADMSSDSPEDINSISIRVERTQEDINKGITVKWKDSANQFSKLNTLEIELIAAIYSDETSDENAGFANAKLVVIDKDAPEKMTKSGDEYIYRMDSLPDSDKWAMHAGEYVAVAVRSKTTNAISSQWSDIVWYKIPNTVLDLPEITDKDDSSFAFKYRMAADMYRIRVVDREKEVDGGVQKVTEVKDVIVLEKKTVINLEDNTTKEKYSVYAGTNRTLEPGKTTGDAGDSTSNYKSEYIYLGELSDDGNTVDLPGKMTIKWNESDGRFVVSTDSTDIQAVYVQSLPYSSNSSKYKQSDISVWENDTIDVITDSYDSYFEIGAPVPITE